MCSKNHSLEAIPFAWDRRHNVPATSFACKCVIRSFSITWVWSTHKAWLAAPALPNSKLETPSSIVRRMKIS